MRALKKLKKGKACGPDGIPGEVFYNCESAARELYELLHLIWEREYRVRPAGASESSIYHALQRERKCERPK